MNAVINSSGRHEGFVEVWGERIPYVRAGSGPALVLIHGLTGSMLNWRFNIDSFARDATVYAIDLLDMGLSSRAAGLDAGLEATACRVIAWMDAVGLGQADLAGHSHGGAVAMTLAAGHPGRVRSLILFAPANPYSASGDWMIRLYSSLPGRALACLAPWLPRRIQTLALGRMYGDPRRIAEGSLDGYIQGLRIRGAVQHVLAIVRGWFGEMEQLRRVLPRIAGVPTLLVWGDRDRAVSLSSAERLHRELASSELIVVPGGGHVVFEELPEAANRAMHEWLTRAEAGGTGRIPPQTAAPPCEQPRPAPARRRR